MALISYLNELLLGVDEMRLSFWIAGIGAEALELAAMDMMREANASAHTPVALGERRIPDFRNMQHMFAAYSVQRSFFGQVCTGVELPQLLQAAADFGLTQDSGLPIDEKMQDLFEQECVTVGEMEYLPMSSFLLVVVECAAAVAEITSDKNLRAAAEHLLELMRKWADDAGLAEEQQIHAEQDRARQAAEDVAMREANAAYKKKEADDAAKEAERIFEEAAAKKKSAEDEAVQRLKLLEEETAAKTAAKEDEAAVRIAEAEAAAKERILEMEAVAQRRVEAQEIEIAKQKKDAEHATATMAVAIADAERAAQELAVKRQAAEAAAASHNDWAGQKQAAFQGASSQVPAPAPAPTPAPAPAPESEPEPEPEPEEIPGEGALKRKMRLQRERNERAAGGLTTQMSSAREQLKQYRLQMSKPIN